MLDLVVRNACLPDGRKGVDVGIRGDKIAEIRPQLDASADREIDAAGGLVAPPFVDPHFHMDATLRIVKDIALDNLRRYIAGEPLRNRVN